jgi:hypothetical protein
MSEIVKDEALNKSIDDLISKLFEDSAAPLAKASDAVHAIIGEAKQAKDPKDPNTKPSKTSDEGLKGVEKEEDEDEEEGKGKKDAKERGRPNDLSQMSMRDMKTGESKGKYDDAIVHDSVKVPDEYNKTGPSKMQKSFEVSEEEYELLQKAKKAREEETLRKNREEQMDLIKSAVGEATKGLKEENEVLKKSLSETHSLLKSLARKPVPQKSISHAAVLEKSFGGGENPEAKRETFSKAEMLDVAEELVKAKKMTVDQVIELEDTGFIYNPYARKILEDELKKRG